MFIPPDIGFLDIVLYKHAPPWWRPLLIASPTVAEAWRGWAGWDVVPNPRMSDTEAPRLYVSKAQYESIQELIPPRTHT